jgi:protein-S-isoprenylcysteine O-methyltransferase Ste14
LLGSYQDPQKESSVTTETVSRVLLPLLFAAFLVLDLALPLARLRRTAGTWGVPLLHTRDRRERAVSAVLVLIAVALAVGTVRFALFGPAGVGAAVPPAPVTLAGYALLVASVALIALAQQQMGASLRVGIAPEATALVSGGLFRWVRNPIFLGMLVWLAGIVLVAPGVWSVSLWLAGAAAIGLQTRLEEQHLRARHGEAYLAYASRVGRFLPGVGRLPAGGR